MKKSLGNRVLFAAVAAALLATATTVRATSGAWEGDSTVAWTNNNNWTGNATYPSTTETATFNAGGNNRTNVNVAGLSRIKYITFDSYGVASYVIGADPIGSQSLVMEADAEYKLNGNVLRSQVFNANLVLGTDRNGGAYNLRNDAPAFTLGVTGNIVCPTNGTASSGKTLRTYGVGSTRISGNIVTNGSVTLTLDNNSSGTLFLTGSNRITRLNLYATPSCAVDIGNGELFLDNLGSTTLYATQDAIITGTGKIKLGTNTGRNYADCYAAPGKTVVVYPAIISDGGFELNTGVGTWVFCGNNLFASNILFGVGGTISVSKIGNQGSTDSNLGMGQRIIMQAGGCKLLYTGAGEATDRIIELSANATLDHSGTGTLLFSTPIDVLGNTKTLTLQGSTSGVGEIPAAIVAGSGTTSLLKDGTGTWRLTATNTYAGTTTVRGGTLALTGSNGTAAASTGYTLATGGTLLLDNSASANNTNRLRDASTVTMTGGTLVFSHSADAADYVENAGQLSLSQNASTVAASRAAPGRTSVLRFASLARTAGAAVNFTGAGLGDADGRNKIVITAQANGLIGPWATVNGTNLAAYSTTLGVYASPEPAYNQEISALGPSTIASNATDNVRISSQGTSGPIELGAPITRVASLTQKTAYDATINTAGKNLQLSVIAIPSGNAGVAVGVAAGDGTLSPLASNGDVALSNDGASDLTVNAVVANNGGSATLTKMGAGTATLAAANTFSGTTTIGGGSLVLANSDALQNSTLSTGGLVFDSSVASHAFTLGGLNGFFNVSLDDNAPAPNAVALSVGKNNASTTLSGNLAGSGSVTKVGSGTLTLSGTNTFSGGLAISAGQVTASTVGALGTAPVVNNAVLNLTGASDIAYTGLSAGLSGSGTNNVTLGTGGSTVYLQGNYAGFTGLWNIGTNAAAGAAKVYMNGADNPAAIINVLSNGTFYCNAGNHTATLILRGGNTGESYGQLRIDSGANWQGPVYLFGEITDLRDAFLGCTAGPAYISGVISDLDGLPHAVGKIGGGTLVLTGENTYKGQTWIQGGLLRVNSMRDVGAASSSLGAPANAANGTVRIGTNVNGATLVYGGMGDASDRMIDMAGSTGYAYLDHSGTNLWKLNGNVISSFPGNKQLRLQGSTGATGEIAGAISDYDATFSNNLYKNGTGTWRLSGVNTFKGNVENNQGALIINNSSALGVGPKQVRLTNGSAGNPQLYLDGSDGDITLASNLSFITSNTGEGALVNVAGNNSVAGNFTLTGGGGGTALQSKAGKLTLSGSFTPDQTLRDMYLRGDGDGEISGIIQNGGTVNMPVYRTGGTGTWVLSGANTFSGSLFAQSGSLVLGGANGALGGGVSVGGGTFVVSNTPSANNGNRLSNAGAVSLGGGTFAYAHSGGAADYSETAGALTVSTGTNRLVTSRADVGQTSTLTFASLARTGGTVDFNGEGLGEDTRNRVVFTTPPALVSNLIGPWATYNGSGLASYDASLGVVAAPASAYTEIAAKGVSVIPDNAALNARITTEGVEGNVDLAGAEVSSVNTLLQSTPYASVVDTSNKLFRTSGIVIAADQASLTVGATEGSGALTALTSGGDVALFNHSATATLTVNAAVSNNTTATTLNKGGIGDVVLTGSNTYSGATVINEGSLEFGGSSTQTRSGIISGAGSLVKSGNGRLILGAANTYTGPTVIKSGVVVAQNSAAFGSAVTGTVIESGATLDIGSTLAANALNLGNEVFTVSGTGVNGLGAIVNDKAAQQISAFGKIVLAGDTTFGAVGRWDIRSSTPTLTLNGYTLTKIGPSEFCIVNANVFPGSGHMVNTQGIFRLEAITYLNGDASNTMLIKPGAILDMWDLGPATNSTPWTLIGEHRASVTAGQGVHPKNTWWGPVTLNGTVFLDAASGRTMGFTNALSGVGSIVKNNTGDAYLFGTNNSYAGRTIVSNGFLHANHSGSLPGYDTTGRVAVAGSGTLVLRTGDGAIGWSKEQIDTVRTNSVFASATAALGIDTTWASLVYDRDIPQALSITKFGNGTLTLTGVISDVGTNRLLRVYGGVNSTLTLANTSSNTFGPVVISGGTLGATLRVDGPTSLGTNLTQTVNIGPAIGDRSTLLISTNFVAGKIYVGNALTGSGALLQTGGALAVAPNQISQDVLSVGVNNGSGYYRLTGGASLAVGQFGVTGGGGAANNGVVDVLDGSISVTGNGGWLIWGWSGGNGVMNIFNGTVTAPAGNNDTTMAYTNNNAAFAMLNLLQPGATLNATGNGIYRGIDMARSGGSRLSSVINLNGGKILANRVRTGTPLTQTLFNFNGGTLKANAGTAYSATFMQGLTAALVYPGGAVLDTTNVNVTLNQPLQAPTGYGATSIPLRYAGLGYIGAPVVQITGGSGSGATAIATVDLAEGSPTRGQVTGLTVTSAGSGYQWGDSLQVSLLGGGYTNAALAYNAELSPNAATGGLTKRGTGTLTLGGTNTYGGTTTISEGTLKLGNALALPTGTPVVLAGGTLDLSGFTVTNAISGLGTVTNGTVVADLSPAGTDALGTDTLALRLAEVQGTYFADVTSGGSSDLVAVQGSISLSGLSLQIVDPDQLNRHRQYTIMTCTGTLTGAFSSDNLPDSRWLVVARADGTVKLVFTDGTLIKVR